MFIRNILYCTVLTCNTGCVFNEFDWSDAFDLFFGELFGDDRKPRLVNTVASVSPYKYFLLLSNNSSSKSPLYLYGVGGSSIYSTV